MYAAYFLNLLHWKRCCSQADDNGWIRLKHDYITRIIPHDIWPQIRDRLWGLGVIAWSGTWMPGCSQGYQVQPRYRETRLHVCRDMSFIRRIKKVYQKNISCSRCIGGWPNNSTCWSLMPIGPSKSFRP